VTGASELEEELEESLGEALETEVADVAEVPEFEDVAVVAFLARAGSLPVTSWMQMPPEVTRKVAVATPATRRRIVLTRRRRSRSRSATAVWASMLEETGRGFSDGVIGVSIQSRGKR
jgi:hypothetical protein